MKAIYLVAALVLALSCRASHTEMIGKWLLTTLTTKDGVPTCIMQATDEKEGELPNHSVMLVQALGRPNLYININKSKGKWTVESDKPMSVKVEFIEGTAGIDVNAKLKTPLTVQSVLSEGMTGSFLDLVRLSKFLRFTWAPGQPPACRFLGRRLRRLTSLTIVVSSAQLNLNVSLL